MLSQRLSHYTVAVNRTRLTPRVTLAHSGMEGAMESGERAAREVLTRL